MSSGLGLLVFEMRRITSEPVHLNVDNSPSLRELQADGVTIVCMPPITTSLYQPLDMGIMPPPPSMTPPQSTPPLPSTPQGLGLGVRVSDYDAVLQHTQCFRGIASYRERGNAQVPL